MNSYYPQPKINFSISPSYASKVSYMSSHQCPRKAKKDLAKRSMPKKANFPCSGMINDNIIVWNAPNGGRYYQLNMANQSWHGPGPGTSSRTQVVVSMPRHDLILAFPRQGTHVSCLNLSDKCDTEWKRVGVNNTISAPDLSLGAGAQGCVGGKNNDLIFITGGEFHYCCLRIFEVCTVEDKTCPYRISCIYSNEGILPRHEDAEWFFHGMVRLEAPNAFLLWNIDVMYRMTYHSHTKQVSFDRILANPSPSLRQLGTTSAREEEYGLTSFGYTPLISDRYILSVAGEDFFKRTLSDAMFVWDTHAQCWRRVPDVSLPVALFRCSVVVNQACDELHILGGEDDEFNALDSHYVLKVQPCHKLSFMFFLLTCEDVPVPLEVWRLICDFTCDISTLFYNWN